MKILKNILIGAGVVFLLILALGAFVAGSSSNFLDEHEPFVKEFTRDFSARWEAADIRDRSTADFLSQIDTPDGGQAMEVFRSLGRLVDTSDFEIDHYSANTNGPTTGVIKFKARFENAEAVITVALQEKEGVVKVYGFHVDPITKIKKQKDVKA